MMKRFLALILLLVSFCGYSQIEKYVPSRPSPPRLVNDFTGTLSAGEQAMLERKLVAYDDSTSNQVAIVIIPTTGDYPINDVALQVLRTWGVGNKERNNGIVILIAKNDRKIDIEVGYGLEAMVADITAKRIIDNDITPAFRQNKYYEGLDKAVDDIIKAAAGEYKAPAGYGNRKGRGIPAGAIMFFIIIIVVILGSIGRRGGGGGMMSRRGWGGFGAGWIIGSMMSGGSRGGGWGGGGGGWSGGGGGGFGGFGGGSGGGGGASGGW